MKNKFPTAFLAEAHPAKAEEIIRKARNPQCNVYRVRQDAERRFNLLNLTSLMGLSASQRAV